MLRHRPARPRIAALLFGALAALALGAVLPGCRKDQTATAAPPKPKPSPPRVSEINLKSYKPNEAGAVMILMYHHFDPKRPSRGLNRKPDDFRKDLEKLYKRGYRPVTVTELVENRMDLPPGKSPVVLTFDDSLPTQFRYVGREGGEKIDPNCAVGILEEFNRKHPDWPVKATFFILPGEGPLPPPFYQPDYVEDKLTYLLEKGCEIANHTATHRRLDRLPPDQVLREIGLPVRYLAEMAPNAKMQSLALPYGLLPKKEAQKYLRAGEWKGTKYENKAVLLAASRPVLSPVTGSKKLSRTANLAAFDPYRLERILPDPTDPGTTFEYWLKFFDANPRLRYISDGNPDVVAVPKAFSKSVVQSRLRPGQVLQVYSPGVSSGVQVDIR